MLVCMHTRWARLALALCVFASLLPMSVAQAAEGARPRVGLVLGGGGARGLAHIGVLKVLEEMRVPISCIAGTSMGALVGGVYAAGVSIDEMTNRISQIDWNALFSDDPARQEKPFRAKRDDYENLFWLELGQRGSKLLLAPGTTAGYKFEFLLREMVEPAGNFADQDFNSLPIPYRAMGTDIENGTSKQFRRGDLVKVMRASMSVPGLIAPVEIDDVLYVDGGLLQNVPVAAARQTCADVVIAVNVGSPLLPRDKLNSALSISLQMIAVLTEQNVRVSLASLRSGDVLIEPELGDFSAANFEQGITLIPSGEAATRAKARALRRLSVSDDDYRAWRASVMARLPRVPEVSDVRVVDTGQPRECASARAGAGRCAGDRFAALGHRSLRSSSSRIPAWSRCMAGAISSAWITAWSIVMANVLSRSAGSRNPGGRITSNSGLGWRRMPSRRVLTSISVIAPPGSTSVGLNGATICSLVIGSS